MTRYPILELCARVEGHEYQHQLLREQCQGFSDWQPLLDQAEKEGMAPLLKLHLDQSGSSCPISAKRALHILAKRHQHQAEVRSRMLGEIVDHFAENGLTPLILKGAALAYTLYPDPALRPMRDMDILLHPDEVDRGQELLRQFGFQQASSPIPPDHFHLPPLLTEKDDVKICIELHRGLYPHCPPWYPEISFARLLKTARAFQVGNRQALTFSNEETLHYLYQHALRAPLTYESYKLINIADIIGFVENHGNNLDWKAIGTHYPILLRALPLLHHITPWNLEKIPKQFVPHTESKTFHTPKPFTGWPKKRRKELRVERKRLYRVLLDTFFPSRWWLGIYYGAATERERLRHLLKHHPLHIFWWVRLYRGIAK
ncbi:MAG: nucleotidyltransferase family protein [Thermodesulfobacteriota bacterium]